MAKLNVTISDDLRREIEAARAKNTTASYLRKRSLSEEVEELLRIALDRRRSEPYLLLKVDPGLWVWMHAYQVSHAFVGNLEDLVIFTMRQAISADFAQEVWRKAMLPYLPKDIRQAIEGRTQPRKAKRK